MRMHVRTCARDRFLIDRHCMTPRIIMRAGIKRGGPLALLVTRKMHFIDAHNHVQKMAGLEAHAAIERMVICGTSPDDWDQVDGVARGNEVIGFGVHPWWAGQWSHATGTVAKLRLALERARLAGRQAAHVGEIGIDKSPRGLRASGGWEAQAAVFKQQLDFAASANLAVSVHCVRAFDELVAFLEPYSAAASAAAGGRVPPGILLHSYAGGPTVTQKLLQLFPLGGSTRLVFSFSGSIVQTVAEAWWAANCGISSAAEDASMSPSRENGDSTSAVASVPSPSSSFRIIGASKQTMSSLAELSYGHIVFETDAPDQGFGLSDLRLFQVAHTSQSKADAGCCSSASGEAASDAASVSGATSGPHGQMLLMHARFEHACRQLFSGDDEGSSLIGSGDAAAKEKVNASYVAQSPSRVILIYWAAALWRAAVAAANAHKGKAKGRGSTAVGAGGASAAAAADTSSCVRLKMGASVVSVSKAASREELQRLQVAAEANVQAVFQQPS